MTKEFNEILDECIDRINGGENPGDCLSRYPGYADQLGQFLQAMKQTRNACDYTPGDNARRESRQRLYEALEKKHSPSSWRQLLMRPVVWASLVTGVAVLLILMFVFQSMMLPADPGWEYISEIPPISNVEPDPGYIAAAHTDGNFVFLVSDEVNAISEFSSLNVTVDRVGLLQAGESGKWVEFIPEIQEFDLTLLPGLKTQEIWRGNIPNGRYDKVFIHITGVNGVLKDSGEGIDIKLPGNKLQITLPFQVSGDHVTSFTYDLTVIKTGKAKSGKKYLLKPQLSESGSSQEPVHRDGHGQNKKTLVLPDNLSHFTVIINRKT